MRALKLLFDVDEELTLSVDIVGVTMPLEHAPNIDISRIQIIIMYFLGIMQSPNLRQRKINVHFLHHSICRYRYLQD